jgi:hypothetical protein
MDSWKLPFVMAEAEDGDGGTPSPTDRGDDIESKTPVEEDTSPQPGGEEATDKQEDEGGKQNIMLPKHRYDRMAARARAAEERIRELEGKLSTRQQTEAASDTTGGDDYPAQLEELDGQIAGALKDGDADKVASLFRQRTAVERDYITSLTTAARHEAAAISVDQMNLDRLIDQLEDTYSALDPNSDQYSEAVVSDVLELQSAYVSTGKYTPYRAMLKAVGVLFPEGQETAPAAAAAPATRKTDVRKNVEAARRTPPNLAKAGLDSAAAGEGAGKIDVKKLTEREFEALPDATKRRLRGDFV